MGMSKYTSYLSHQSAILTLNTYQPFTAYFPWADIHELLSPNLLHQVIKGTFKYHIVTWVNKYLVLVHSESAMKEVIDDIDHWCMVMAHHFEFIIDHLMIAYLLFHHFLAFINSLKVITSTNGQVMT